MASQPTTASTEATQAMPSAASLQSSNMPPSLQPSGTSIAASRCAAVTACWQTLIYISSDPAPNNWGPYMFGLVSHPSSPVTIGYILIFTTLGIAHSLSSPLRPPSTAQQPMTPDASPFAGRKTPPRPNFPATPQFMTPSNASEDSPLPTISFKANGLESPISIPSSKRVSTPNQALSVPDRASPFMARLAMVDRQASSQSPQTPHRSGSFHAGDIFASTSSNPFHTATSGGERPTIDSPSRLSSPPTPPPINADIAAGVSYSLVDAGMPLPVGSGGELQRIRRAEMEQQLAQYQEAESRRPEYLVRTKRTLVEADPTAFDESLAPRERNLGIMDSPSKGRRIKLFQETSEESFEESLMAGGYGRYRTADWVRAPQPIPPMTQRLTPTPAATAPNNTDSPENIDPTPPPAPTEKELRKRKRLAAFKGESPVGNTQPTKLMPVELAGKGRVLLDVLPSELPEANSASESTPKKKATAGRRRKKPEERRTLAATVMTADLHTGDRPNWPDAEFPWKLRTDEREEHARQEEEEKLKWIEKFLDRESDDEADSIAGTVGEDEEILPSASWGQVYEDTADRPMPPRRGRGKMVPLHADPEAARRPRAVTVRSFFPSDPGDARAALLAKKSVRALSFRRSRALTDRQNEMICVCKGRDDGNDLVQCDGCRTWYHLRCLGIRNMAELGKEEDPWYCERCVDDRSLSSDDEHEPVVYREPTFVPTEDLPAFQRAHDDASFFPSLSDSPFPSTDWQSMRVPCTPPRRDDPSSDFTSSSWSRSGPPTTPRQNQFPTTPRVFMQTPNSGLFEDYDDSFDPMSTPSRGIRVPAHFTTPKTNGTSLLWAANRSVGAVGQTQTPRPRTVQHHKPPSGGRPGGNLFSPSARARMVQESPVQRAERENRQTTMNSPAMRSLNILAQASVEESPIVRSTRADDQAARQRAEYGNCNMNILRAITL
ncbi:hypothetical protein EV121DRAFT_265319 [Schizophyllum commune]